MKPMHLKFTIAGAVMVASLAYLAFAASRGGMVYHLTVDQFLSSPQYHDQRVRLCGTVDSANFAADSAALSARFALLGTGARIGVQYHGVIPDLFKPRGEVVIEGRLDPAGIFQADVLMTKCASKYQSTQTGPAAGGQS
ncbi:MAG TPA: cytochrome c maturation protein CcmE [Tepidisphaeraceae bacterium]|nr:cytochrome c maturation protein CcmE [Tepidisphaeraceae bacterium]